MGMRAERREALLDFLLEAVADEGAAAFPASVLVGLRRVVACETVSYWEWTPQEVLESSLFADDPEVVSRVWGGYQQVRHDDPLAGGPDRANNQNSLPDDAWLGQALAISDFLSDRQFRSRGLYAEICKPLGVRAVLKVFLPTGGAIGAELVFDTTRSRFTDSDREILQRIVPHLGQLRRNAHARKTCQALLDSTAPARARLQRLTPCERVVLTRVAAGETNPAIAQALFVSSGTVRKHLEHIYGKLEVRNRAAAAAVYTQEQVVTESTVWTPGSA
jgi:DNA-binding CsgD family transcriptional regulator